MVGVMDTDKDTEYVRDNDSVMDSVGSSERVCVEDSDGDADFDSELLTVFEMDTVMEGDLLVDSDTDRVADSVKLYVGVGTNVAEAENSAVKEADIVTL